MEKVFFTRGLSLGLRMSRNIGKRVCVYVYTCIFIYTYIDRKIDACTGCGVIGETPHKTHVASKLKKICQI